MMTPERWTLIKEIFAAVVDQPGDARPSALAELCRGDEQVRAEVEKLLQQHDEMGGFLDGPPAASITTPAPSQLVPGDIVAGRYRIVEFLGRGGMGEVYEAEDAELGERVALKVIRHDSPLGSDLIDRLRREVQLARRVTHPNVCRVFDLGHDRRPGREIIFLTMELIRGETLNARLKRCGAIAFPEATQIARQLCLALGAAHEAGILHRDFKCGNVMLLGSGEQVRAVVTDFGIARWIQQGDGGESGATRTGMVVGTPAYMSPEQLMGEKLTAASDIYSLGLVLYEIVTGVRPFHDESGWTESLKRLTAEPPAPAKVVPGLDPRWNRTIVRCLQRNPSRRFSTTGEVASSLMRRYRYSWRDAPRPVIAAALCAVIVLAAAGFMFRGRLWRPSLPKQKHVAVLPFSHTSGGPADQAVAYGLAESLSGNLGRLQVTESSLWVVPWKEVRSQKPEDMGRAASTLGANLLVTGKVERAAGKLRLLAAVKDARNLENLGTQVIEVPEGDMRALEDTLLERVSAMLQLRVPPGMLHHLPVDETLEPGAFEFYEQGRGYLLHYNPEDVDRAIVLLQKATEKDPKFALAYANLASAYAWKYRETRDPRLLEQARSLAGKALALNDKLAAAHLALATVQRYTKDIDSAIHELELALQLDPMDAETLNTLALAYDESGRLLQAEALLKDALKRSPGSWANYNYLGFFYYRHQQYAQAEPLFRTAVELAPDNPMSYDNLGGVYLAQGRYPEAESILSRAISIKPDANGYSNLGTARFYLGRYSDAAAMFQKATELRPGDHRFWRNLGDAYKLAGEPQKAAQAYEKARVQLENVLKVRPRDGQLLGVLALYYAKLGQREAAQQKLAQAAKTGAADGEFFFNSALVQELTGRRKAALTSLHSAVQAGYSLAEIRNAHELAQLRKDSRFTAILGNSETPK